MAQDVMPPLLKAIGLNKSPNLLDVPPGSLIQASNVILRRDNVIEPRRGYKLFGNSFGSADDIAAQMVIYQNTILRNYDSTLQFDTHTTDTSGTEIFADFCGSFMQPEIGRKMRFIESNGNLYFTTSTGVQRISAASASQFTTACPYIVPAGGIKALDITGYLVPDDSAGFLPQDSQVAYRVVWGITDANDNLILGTPSSRFVISNPLINLELMDFNNLLSQIDNAGSVSGSLIDDQDYVQTLALPITASAGQLLTNLIALTVKIDNNIVYADNVSVAPLQISGATISGTTATINFSSGTATNYFTTGENQQIFLTGFNVTDVTTTGNTSTNNVNTTATASSGSNQLTVASAAGISIEMPVSGAGIAPGTTVEQISGTTITISQNTTAALSATPVTFQGQGSNQLTSLASTTGIVPGMVITGLGIPTGTTVVSIAGSTVTMSNMATAQNTGISVTFSASGTLDGVQTVLTATSNTITFTTSASGIVTLSSPATINDYEYESIIQPSTPSIPSTDAQLVAIQQYMQSIITQLQSENTFVIPSGAQPYIQSISLTTSANVELEIPIPAGITTNYFLQIYRSPIAQATGTQVLATDVSASDELQLVYEAFVTQDQINAGVVDVLDTTPDIFLGAYLYTNAVTGTGITSANDIPPFCLDVNLFKNVVFYANTRTRYRLDLNLLGVSAMIADFNNSIIPSFLITDGTSLGTTTYTFTTGLPQITTITTNDASTLVQSASPASYFTINNANNITEYYFWYQVGSSQDPMISGKTGIPVIVGTGDTAAQVAQKTFNNFLTIPQDFIPTPNPFSGTTITVTNVNIGPSTNATAGTSGFTVSTTQTGRTQDPSTQTILLSTNPSVGQAIDETARSIVAVINANPNSPVYAYYLSAVNGVPGQILLEDRTLTNNPFYIIANNSDTGGSFNPNISPEFTITNITAANPAVVTFTPSALPQLPNLDQVIIMGTNSTPKLDGIQTITTLTNSTFSVPVHTTISGNAGVFTELSSAVVASNENRPNRIYYSQFQQPDAVPIVNFIDVGARDKQILRIFPLRDSLFVYKEDGLFRISGETAPFNLALFDSSCILLVPDSLDVSNNLIYGWTTQGITATSEAGVQIVSRPIDVDILKLATAQYTNFRNVTWGMGYEADNSYTVYTVSQTSDTLPQIAYRYSSLTNSWTTFNRSATCGIIDPVDGKQYLGAGDTNFIEQERKDFTRYDYTDREIPTNLTANNYMGTTLQFQSADVKNMTVGDVLYQLQYLTIYDYNMLLLKLDNDVTLTHTYNSSLQIKAGVDLRLAVNNLITQIANDPKRLLQSGATLASVYEAYGDSIYSPTSGTITAISAQNPTQLTSTAHKLQTGRVITINGSASTPSIDGTWVVTVLDANTFTIDESVIESGTIGTINWTIEDEDFRDIQASYNGTISLLNLDDGVTFANYNPVTMTTVVESIIENINPTTFQVMVNLALSYVVGPLLIMKAIPTNITWAPVTLGDPVGLKHMREASLFFDNKAFTNATLSFSSDLLPSYFNIPFLGDGNGIFGYVNNLGKGFGSGFFGGGSSSIPFHTYIPRDKQRCRFLNVMFSHSIARESYSIYGLSLIGEITQSSRAFR